MDRAVRVTVTVNSAPPCLRPIGSESTHSRPRFWFARKAGAPRVASETPKLDDEQQTEPTPTQRSLSAPLPARCISGPRAVSPLLPRMRTGRPLGYRHRDQRMRLLLPQSTSAHIRE